MVPAPDSDTIVVNSYVGVKLTVYVTALDGIVKLCEIAPLSDHLLNK